MSLERRVELAQRDDIFDGEVAGEGQAEIKRRRLVSARPDDAVAVRPLGILGIVVGDLEVERRDNVHHGERSAGVAGAGGAQRDQVIAAHQAGGLFQFFDGEIATTALEKALKRGMANPWVRGDPDR